MAVYYGNKLTNIKKTSTDEAMAKQELLELTVLKLNTLKIRILFIIILILVYFQSEVCENGVTPWQLLNYHHLSILKPSDDGTTKTR